MAHSGMNLGPAKMAGKPKKPSKEMADLVRDYRRWGTDLSPHAYDATKTLPLDTKPVTYRKEDTNPIKVALKKFQNETEAALPKTVEKEDVERKHKVEKALANLGLEVEKYHAKLMQGHAVTGKEWEEIFKKAEGELKEGNNDAWNKKVKEGLDKIQKDAFDEQRKNLERSRITEYYKFLNSQSRWGTKWGVSHFTRIHPGPEEDKTQNDQSDITLSSKEPSLLEDGIYRVDMKDAYGNKLEGQETYFELSENGTAVRPIFKQGYDFTDGYEFSKTWGGMMDALMANPDNQDEIKIGVKQGGRLSAENVNRLISEAEKRKIPIDLTPAAIASLIENDPGQVEAIQKRIKLHKQALSRIADEHKQREAPKKEASAIDREFEYKHLRKELDSSKSKITPTPPDQKRGGLSPTAKDEFFKKSGFESLEQKDEAKMQELKSDIDNLQAQKKAIEDPQKDKIQAISDAQSKLASLEQSLEKLRKENAERKTEIEQAKQFHASMSDDAKATFAANVKKYDETNQSIIQKEAELARISTDPDVHIKGNPTVDTLKQDIEKLAQEIKAKNTALAMAEGYKAMSGAEGESAISKIKQEIAAFEQQKIAKEQELARLISDKEKLSEIDRNIGDKNAEIAGIEAKYADINKQALRKGILGDVDRAENLKKGRQFLFGDDKDVKGEIALVQDEFKKFQAIKADQVLSETDLQKLKELQIRAERAYKLADDLKAEASDLRLRQQVWLEKLPPLPEVKAAQPPQPGAAPQPAVQDSNKWLRDHLGSIKGSAETGNVFDNVKAAVGYDAIAEMHKKQTELAEAVAHHKKHP